MFMIIFNDKCNFSGLVLLSFSAPWCSSCKIAHPTVLKLEQEFSEIKFYEVDIDDNEDLVQKFNIRTIPTFVILNNDKEVKRFSGAIFITPFRKVLRDLIKEIKNG